MVTKPKVEYNYPMKLILPSRQQDAHKGACGRLLVVAGSRGMTGAATLVCRAAYRVGVGYVRLILPHSLVPFVDVTVPEVVTIGAAETKAGTLSTKALAEIETQLSKSDVLAIGPGLSQNGQTKNLIKIIMSKIDTPMVIDADALIPYRRAAVRLYPTIMTPHVGELARLMEVTTETIQANREAIAREAALKFNTILVLKGHQTVVTDGERLYINISGNSGMATAGMGDVLTGVIAGLQVQGLSAWEAACSGVNLHGKSGDLVYKEKGNGLIASDVIEKLPEVLKHE